MATLPPPTGREWSSLWDKQTACQAIADAKSCEAKAAQSCYWYDDLNTCTSDAWHTCGKDTSSMGCRIQAAANASSKACAKFTKQSTCKAEDACQWSSADSACYRSYTGTLLVYKQLGSKIATAFIAQNNACYPLRKKNACLASPPRQSATSSFARGKACDWYGGDEPCDVGTEFRSLLFASADNDIDRSGGSCRC
jgi:hypothetical protein